LQTSGVRLRRRRRFFAVTAAGAHQRAPSTSRSSHTKVYHVLFCARTAGSHFATCFPPSTTPTSPLCSDCESAAAAGRRERAAAQLDRQVVAAEEAQERRRATGARPGDPRARRRRHQARPARPQTGAVRHARHGDACAAFGRSAPAPVGAMLGGVARVHAVLMPTTVVLHV
jgi:hypothetical protein